jgi:hypothetical protein
MSTSIITTTTFTIATIIDVQAQVPAAAALPSLPDDFEITQCMLNELPRCGLTAEKHCGRRSFCKSK